MLLSRNKSPKANILVPLTEDELAEVDLLKNMGEPRVRELLGIAGAELKGAEGEDREWLKSEIRVLDERVRQFG